MSTWIWLSLRSLKQRRIIALLAAASIALSLFLVLSIQHLQGHIKAGFEKTISGTDLVVGARSGPLNLVLYSVFGMGDPTPLFSEKALHKLEQIPEVDWVVPILLGDNFKDFRVLGTTDSYFDKVKFGQNRRLEFAEGGVFNEPLEAVIGWDVAQAEGLHLGSSITLSHGGGFQDHDQHRFRVTGILKPTGTPNDRSVITSLASIEIIHEGWEDGAPPKKQIDQQGDDHADEHHHEEHEEHHADEEHHHGDHDEHHADEHHHGGHDEHAHEEHDHPADSYNAAFVGLKSRPSVFKVQRQINEFEGELLTAVLPGATIFKLWTLVASVEDVLRLISWISVLVAFIGLSVLLLSLVNERRKEMAILRAQGLGLNGLFAMVMIEALILVIAGVALGTLLLAAVLQVTAPIVQQQFGIWISGFTFNADYFRFIAAMLIIGALSAMAPAYLQYKKSIRDGIKVPG